MTVRATSVGRETRGAATIDDLAIDAGEDPPLEAYLISHDGPPGSAQSSVAAVTA